MLSCKDAAMNTPLSKVERQLMAKIGRRGGKARKRNLTPERLAEIGRMGAKARHAKRNGS
jgi:general stress protein YciG